MKRFASSASFAVVVTTAAIAFHAAGCSSSTASAGAAGGTDNAPHDGGAADDGKMSPSATASSFEVRMATVNCALQERCGSAYFAAYYANQADCVARVSKSYVGQLHAASTAITDAEVTACTAAYAARSCSTAGYPASCVFKGNAESGAACSYSTQCKSGSCYSVTGHDCGVCKDLVALGGDCSAARCSPPTYCSSAKTCVPAQKEGGSCAAGVECDSDLQCDPKTSTCQKVAVLGEDCSKATGHTCDLTMDCLDDRCVAQGTAAVGVTCGTDDTGKTTSCLQSQCTGTDDNDANGKCTAWPALGGPCDEKQFIYCDQNASCVDGICKLTVDLRVCK